VSSESSLDAHEKDPSERDKERRGIMAANHLAFRRALLAGVFGVAFGFPMAAEAQSDAETTAGGGDIVVTAQRREELLQDVPLSVTALTSESLQNSAITNSRELALVTPGLRFDSTGSTVVPTIRGITTTLAGGSEPNVAVYVDGVVQVSASSAVFELPDVQQVEVLKGPQGTLFGRNATGGAILIRTLQPDLTEVTGKWAVSYSSFETVRASGFISVPVATDKVAASVSGYYENMSKGYITDLTAGGKVQGGTLKSYLVRGKLRVKPWDGADFTLQGLYQKRNDHVILRNSNWRGNNAQAISGAYTGPLADGPYEVATNLDPFTLTSQANVSLRGDIEAGPGAFTITTAYVDNDAFLVNDSDNTPRAVALLTSGFDIHTFTQELLYTTEQLGRFRAVAGVNYFHNRIVGNLASNVNAFVDRNIVRNKAFAAFGEATFDITDQLSLTGGLRYSWEKKSAFKASVFGTTVLPAVIPALAPPKSWDSIDPRVSLVFEASDDLNIYATFSKGFKSGEFNVSGASAQRVPINPEKITAYEVGVKGKAADALTFSLAGFHYDYKDLQVTAFQTINNVITSQLTNAASAKIWGAEFNGDWRITPDFRLTFGLSYLDAEYADFPGASYTTPRRDLPGNACPVPPNASATSPICTITSNEAGNTMVRAPKWSGNVTAAYSRQTGVGTFDASATLFASSKVFFDVSNRVVQPNYAQLNATLAWSPYDKGWQIRLWGKNLTDKAAIVSLVNTTAYDTVTYNPPRSYGVEVNYKF
jgi:iron complex outermembrane receptor protein